MAVYAFWNNKGGTGKTSLAFQVVCKYAEINRDKKILVIDLCPQANLSELFLGGLIGNGGKNLAELYNQDLRISVGGYFQDRLPSPFTMPIINTEQYLVTPNKYNHAISENIDLLAGDPIVELQTNAIATLANTQLPGTDTWIAVIDWIRDFINSTNKKYDEVFIDCNPSFSIYTQIAISSSDRLLLPVMADDSSRRALQNAFSLIYGIKLPSSVYNQFSFSTKLQNAKRMLPLVHLIIKNRQTQYMGPASAYHSVLKAIDDDLNIIMRQQGGIFTFTSVNQGMVEVRDFQTTGVVAFAEGKPFTQVRTGNHNILGKTTQVSRNNLDNCNNAIDNVVTKL